MLPLFLACQQPPSPAYVLLVPDETDTATDPSHDEAWDDLVHYAQSEVDHDGIPGISFAVILDGELAYAGAVGVAVKGSSIPLTPETVGRWNSVSKVHTALATMQLVDEGLLDLQAPIGDYVDVTVTGPYAGELTLHQAMTHTTGLPDGWDGSCDTSLSAYWAEPSEALLAEPGTLYNYSNTGWSLTGHVLEAVTGEDFVDLMHDRVLTPAGMQTATFDPAEINAEYTIGYDSGSLYTPEFWDCAYLRPAGWLHASALDLAAMTEQLLANPDERMLEHHDTFWASGSEAGYGLFSWDLQGVTAVSHGGAGVGHRSYLLMVPEQGFGVVVMAPTRHFASYTFAHRAATLFVDFPEDWQAPDLQTDERSVWSGYEGLYEDNDGVGTVEIDYDTSYERLYITFLDGSNSRRRLYQAGGDEFFYQLEDEDVYVRLAAGRYVANRYWVADKEAPSGPPPERESIVALEMLSGKPTAPGDED